ncbi:MAG: hypothetical protein KKH41_03435 [Candidatus Thermoplasmatota archaeon]|nr:hypothetical protein [Euryarchaeota archaeon]MBU4032386.1 hypothetical protein [Candidatus Thermoplasmatota archaeon]MBU4071125.1 hypothetical protein [Candidatus Thermoplasmatota archaeon]MBU4144811.1 hypothetical protein [Candidatus Thermoplasmatota archaeon]MBU4591619.1 hypothetical protein [Candidatus Thermoplasmatota archaeon]
MSPVCTACGQEVTYVQQYQQWYCHRCGIYPYLQQVAAPFPPQMAYPQPMFFQPPSPTYSQPFAYQPYSPPAVTPNPQLARAKIHGSFMMRQSTDEFIPTWWAWIILMFQVILPVFAVIAVLFLVQGTNLNISDVGFLFTIIMAVLLVSIALAISHAVLVHKLVRRRDEHFRRDVVLNDGLNEYLGAVALDTNIDLNVERWTMNTIRLSGYTPDRSPMLWAMLVSLIAIISFVGAIFLLYSQVFLTKDIHEHDEKQRALNYHFQQGMVKAGKMKQISHDWQPLPKRDIAAYVIMTVLTLGLFLPYWWYVNIVDMNTHMRNQWKFEDMLIENLRTEG